MVTNAQQPPVRVFKQPGQEGAGTCVLDLSSHSDWPTACLCPKRMDVFGGLMGLDGTLGTVVTRWDQTLPQDLQSMAR